MIRLFIDGMEAELPANVELAVTKQVATVFNISERQTDFTNRFILPRSPKNINLMQQLGINGNGSDRPYKFASARLEYNTIVYADSLVALVDVTSSTGYEVRLYGNPRDFSEQMKSKQLRDVVDLFPVTEINYNAANFAALQASLGGITFPLISQLRPFPNKDNRFLWIDLAYPAFFTKDLIEKMLLQYFSSYTSLAMSTNTYQQEGTLAMSTTNQAWQDFERIQFEKEEVEFFNLGPLPLSTIMFGWYFDPIKDSKGQLLDITQANDPDGYKYEVDGLTIYRVPAARQIKITYRLEFEFADLTSNPKYKIQLRKKDSATADISITDTVLAETDFYETPGTFIVDGEISVNVKNGEDLYWVVYGELLTNDYSFTVRDFTCTFQPLRQGIFQDAKFEPKYLLPNMTEWEYFQDLVKRFGLVFQTQGDTLRIESFKDIFDGAFGIEDWTGKIVKELSETYEFGDYFKRSIFKYSGDLIPKTDPAFNGWDDLTLDNDRYKEEGNLIESNGIGFSSENKMQGAQPNVAAVGGFEVVDSDKVYLENVNNLAYCYLLQNQDFNFYFLLNLKFGTTFSAYTGVDLEPPSDFQCLPIRINWEDRISKYYGDLLTSIERPIVKNLEIYLTELEFYALDFFKIKYFSQYQAYFYLLKAENYIPGKPLKCQLLKIQRA